MVLHKYCGSGNDFLIFHTFKHQKRSEFAKKVCDRHYGIGADGLAVLLPHSKYPYEWEFYNSDGSEATMCGNASRCVAHYAYHQGFAPANHSFLTQAGEIQVKVKDNVVESNLGSYKSLKKIHLNIQEYNGDWYLIDTGVPHLVHFVKEESKIPYSKNPILAQLRQNYNANVNIAFIQENGFISLSTYERGVEDITLACGTGMAAVFAIASMYYGISKKAILMPPSQEQLTLSFKDKNILYKGEVKYIGICIFNQNK